MSATKEPSFFAGPAGDVPYGAPRVASMADYRALFNPYVPVRGEASPSYSAYPRRLGVPGRIRECVPDARIIYLVRDPIERTVSHYLHRVAVEGEHRTITEALADLDPANIYVSASCYGTQLEQYLMHFPAPSILVIKQEELGRARSETLRRIFAFLGVAEDFTSPRFALEYRGSDARRRFPRWYRAALDFGARTPLARLPASSRRRLRARIEGAVLPGLPEVALGEQLRARLADVLRPEAERLRKLTGLDTATWSL